MTPTSESGLVASQKDFYEALAPTFRDGSAPSDRRVRAAMDALTAAAIVRELAPGGAVLELACGSGFFTTHLADRAASLTAVDASATMLERCRSAVAGRGVEIVRADLFSWTPDRRYDAVFFGFWLSHVPPGRFDAFWDLVRRSLEPGGVAMFVDEDARAHGLVEDTRLVDGVPTATRTVADGRRFEIVKVFWEADALTERLGRLGWDADIRLHGDTTLVGVARDRPAACRDVSGA